MPIVIIMPASGGGHKRNNRPKMATGIPPNAAEWNDITKKMDAVTV